MCHASLAGENSIPHGIVYLKDAKLGPVFTMISIFVIATDNRERLSWRYSCLSSGGKRLESGLAASAIRTIQI